MTDTTTVPTEEQPESDLMAEIRTMALETQQLLEDAAAVRREAAAPIDELEAEKRS